MRVNKQTMESSKYVCNILHVTLTFSCRSYLFLPVFCIKSLSRGTAKYHLAVRLYRLHWTCQRTFCLHQRPEKPQHWECHWKLTAQGTEFCQSCSANSLILVPNYSELADPSEIWHYLSYSSLVHHLFKILGTEEKSGFHLWLKECLAWISLLFLTGHLGFEMRRCCRI